jgi:PAS domain-containing protein
MATLSFPGPKGAEGARSGTAIVERLLDAVDSAVFAVDRELRYLAYNQAHATDMRDLFGVRLALGDHVLEMIPDPDVRGNLRQALMHGLAGERFEDEYRLSVPERRASWFRAEVVPLHGPGGTVDAVAVVARDVTDIHQSEDAAAREIQRYRALMRASMDGVHVVDRTGRVVDANPAFCRMLGRSSEEVLGLHV